MKQVQASSVVDTRQPGIAPQTNARTVEHAKRSANYLTAMKYGPKPHDFHVSSEIVSHAVLVKVQKAEMQAVIIGCYGGAIALIHILLSVFCRTGHTLQYIWIMIKTCGCCSQTAEVQKENVAGALWPMRS